MVQRFGFIDHISTAKSQAPKRKACLACFACSPLVFVPQPLQLSTLWRIKTGTVPVHKVASFVQTLLREAMNEWHLDRDVVRNDAVEHLPTILPCHWHHWEAAKRRERAPFGILVEYMDLLLILVLRSTYFLFFLPNPGHLPLSP